MIINQKEDYVEPIIKIDFVLAFSFSMTSPVTIYIYLFLFFNVLFFLMFVGFEQIKFVGVKYFFFIFNDN